MTASYVEGHALLGDTIVAQSTPAGRSAIAVIRISGPRAHEIARRHLSMLPERARFAELATFRDTEGSTVDHPVVTRFDAPASYTGEDVVELSTHGGLAAPALVIEQLVRSGARPAEPGEFTRRAVLNGKLDLIQAEAVGDLIDARSRALHRAAVNQLDRGLSRRIEGLREALLAVEAMLAYDIDFPEEDEGPIARERITEAGAAVLERIEALLATAPAGELLREGAVVVIAGQPNVGKSSLFNALIGRARAIVTDVPGTTRDALEAVIEGSRWPIRLIDTAGLRDTQEIVERLGVEVSERHVAAADVVLACGDGVDALRAAVERCQQLARGAAVLPVRTKIDLVAKRDFFRHDASSATDGDSAAVSAETGEGLRDLLARVESLIDTRVGGQPSDAPTITRERHRAALETARDEVRAFAAAWEGDALPATVAAVHLRAAAGALEELIGTLDVEDVLDVVFRSFCVGK